MTATKLTPISEALGRKIACPVETGEGTTCGHPVLVKHARGRVSQAAQSQPIMTAAQWYLCECSKSGSKLYKRDTMVEVIE